MRQPLWWASALSRPRATLRPKSGTAAQSARLSRRRNGWEEPPRVRGQWLPGGDTPRLRSGRLAARRNSPASEASGSLEETPRIQSQGQLLRGTTPRPRPSSEVRGGWEKPPRAQGQGRQLGRATHAQGQGRWLGGATQGPVAVPHPHGFLLPLQ